MESRVKPSNPCQRFMYFKDGEPVYKNKVKYGSKEAAQKKADEFNKQEKAIHYAVPYLCPVCGNWHIGRSRVELTGYRKRQLRNGTYTTDGERELSELRERISKAPKIDLKACR